MFIGHFAVGFAAKRAAPRTSLTVLLLAAIFLDVLWPVLVALGVERVRIAPGTTPWTPLDFTSYPISHSLVMALVWSALFAAVYQWRTRYPTGALWAGLLVFSHWVLDWISHRPDLPIAPGLATKVGLGLWYSVPATMAVEITMFVIGLALYLSATRARNWMGHASLWLLVALLALGYSSRTPPPSVGALTTVSFVMIAVTVLILLWIDRTRELRPGIDAA